MATKPKKPAGRAAKPKKPTQRDAIFAMAAFIAALPPQPSAAEARRQQALAAARAIGWKG